jgi:hypothetical protein
LRAPISSREGQLHELLPGGQRCGLGRERADVRQRLGAAAQALGQERAQRAQPRRNERLKARVHARAQHARLLPGHEAQPVAALAQELRDEALEVHPVVVEPFEEALEIRGERRIALRLQERVAGRARVELARGLGHVQRAAHARGDRQLAGERVVEGIDRLDPQALRRTGEVPAARRAVRERRGGVRLQLRGGRIGGGELRAQRADDARPHLRRRLAREGDGENLRRVLDRA